MGNTEVSARQSCLAESRCTGYAKTATTWEIYCDQTMPIGTCTEMGNGGTSVTIGSGLVSTEPCYVRRCNHFISTVFDQHQYKGLSWNF